MNTKYYSLTQKSTKSPNGYYKVKDDKSSAIKEKLRRYDNEYWKDIDYIFEKSKDKDITFKDFKDYGQKLLVETNKTKLMKRFSSTVVFNGAKRAAQLSSCRNTGDVMYVISLLKKDLGAVKACAKNGVCDEGDIAKIKAMMKCADKKLKEIAKEERETGEKKPTGLCVL